MNDKAQSKKKSFRLHVIQHSCIRIQNLEKLFAGEGNYPCAKMGGKYLQETNEDVRFDFFESP